MSERKRFIYMPKEKKSVLLRVCGSLFCLGTLLMWVFASRLGIDQGDLRIMTGIAVLLATLSINGARAERRNKDYSKTIEKIRDETGKGDYNSDIFFKD